MESPLQSAAKHHTLSDTSSTLLSEVVDSWEDESPASVIGKQLKSPHLGKGLRRLPSRKLDASGIDRKVVLAQPLNREEQKDLHFFLQRYRLLSNRVVEVARNLQSQVFLITSALAEEGKTLTSANLAFALSGIERKRTLLIDLDLRRYTLHSLLGVQPGTHDQPFLKAAEWRDCLWSIRPNLDALLNTRPVEQPDKLLHSSTLHNLLTAAREEYDYIIIDSAPLLLAADTHTLLSLIDQALLVVRADHTPIACSQDALKILGDKAVGCILNDVKRLKYESYYHGYYGNEKQ
jgi:capsular exopolysaccharide synthesis family protein